MPFSEYVLSNEGIEIDIHVLKDQIDISVVLSPNNFLEFDDIGMVKLHKKGDLSIGPLSVGGVIKCIKIFF